MISEQLKNIVRDGEGLNVEFKECRTQINRDVYETVCAFSNRNGGHIVLGVDDDGKITGVEAYALPQIKKDLVTTLNNLRKSIHLCIYCRKLWKLKEKPSSILEFLKVHRSTAVMERYLTATKMEILI